MSKHVEIVINNEIEQVENVDYSSENIIINLINNLFIHEELDYFDKKSNFLLLIIFVILILLASCCILSLFIKKDDKNKDEVNKYIKKLVTAN